MEYGGGLSFWDGRLFRKSEWSADLLGDDATIYQTATDGQATIRPVGPGPFLWSLGFGRPLQTI